MIKAANSGRLPVSQYIAEEIRGLGVFHVFGYQGANITYMVDSISAHSELKYIQTSHEQGAAFAANGYAQASRVMGVAATSGGPGALNLVTGIANAFCDSIPTLYICGDLSRRHKKSEFPLRQDGFQSTDIISIVRPISKYAAQIESPDDVRYCLERAIFEATNGRRGPSILSIPHWIQNAEIDPALQKRFISDFTETITQDEFVSGEIRSALAKSQRPLVLLGGGCANKAAAPAVERFLTQNSLPAVSSLCGLSAIPHDHSSYVGYIGDYGHRHANIALAASDCLIVLGSRLDERQVGFLKENWKSKTVIHVDIDPAELLSPSGKYFPVLGTISNFLNALNFINFDKTSLLKWRSNLLDLEKKYPIHVLNGGFSPSLFLSNLFTLLCDGAQVYVDVGIHQMCAAQFGVLTNGKQLYFSGGLGSMGYALPASIGGHLARPDLQTICIAGDGGLMMSLPELQTITRDGLDVKIIVMNNHCLGMVRNHQVTALGGRTIGTVDGYLAGDFANLAKGFHLDFFRIETLNELEKLEDILCLKGPALIEVIFPNDSMMPFPASVNYPLCDDVLVTESNERSF